MGKRIGANSRIRRTQNRSQRLIRLLGVLAVLAAGALAVAAGAGLFSGIRDAAVRFACRFDRSGDVKVRHVVLKGVTHCGTAELMRQSALEIPATVRRIKRDWCGALRAASPWIETARFAGTHGDTAVITVVERRPVALFGKGKIAVVDSQGVFLPFDSRIPAGLPLVSGLNDSLGGDGVRRLTGGSRGRLNRFLRAAMQFDRAFAAGITQAHFRPDQSVLVMRAEGVTAVVLDERDMPARLRRFAQIWERVRNDSPAPALIDLTCQNLAFVNNGGAGTARAAGERTVRKNRG